MNRLFATSLQLIMLFQPIFKCFNEFPEKNIIKRYLRNFFNDRLKVYHQSLRKGVLF